MKKSLIRFVIAAILASGAYALSYAEPSTSSCWETAYNKWSQCDGAYSTTTYNKSNETSYCGSVAASACSAYLGTPDYSTCYTLQHNNCVVSVDNAWDDRANGYGSCLNPEGKGENCKEAVDTDCSYLASRYNNCAEMYPDDFDAAATCRDATGYDAAGCR